MKIDIKKNLVSWVFLYFSTFAVTHCYAVAVGDSYGGGTVFCVSQTEDTTQCQIEGSGDYGLIMANEDQANLDSPNSGITWAGKHLALGSKAQSQDNGAANTAAIIAALPEDNVNNSAAYLAHNYRDPAGHADWYLPSSNELGKMRSYAKANNLIGRGCAGSRAGGIQCLIGGYNEQYKFYWSSSESADSPANYVWDQHFGSGNWYVNDKLTNFGGVRAIRAFNDNHPIGLAGLIALAESLKSNKTLTELNFHLGSKELDAPCMAALKEIQDRLGENKKLATNLSKN